MTEVFCKGHRSAAWPALDSSAAIQPIGLIKGSAGFTSPDANNPALWPQVATCQR